MNKNSTKFACFLLGVLCLAFGNFTTVLANRNGTAGVSQTGCTCHDQEGGVSMTIENESGTIYMRPGETKSFTAIVAHATLQKAGVNIAVQDSANVNKGQLSVGSGLKILTNEITHSAPQNMNNGEIRLNFTWTAPNSEGQFFLRGSAAAVDGNFWSTGDAWVVMGEIQIVVSNPHITLTSPNGGGVLCRGNNMLVSWSSIFVSGNINIDLSNNGTNWQRIASAIPASSHFYNWTILPGQTAGTTYKVRVTDATDANVNDISDANFSILTVPAITSHPKTDSACLGSPITFSVATDNQPYTYQWRKNSEAIVGATSSSYTIGVVQQTDVGNYDVVITGCSSVASNPASFTLIAPPSILSQSNDTTVCRGSSVTLSCNVVGANAYQWKRNGTIVAGVFTPSITIASVTSADTGTYILMVNGKCPPPQSSNPISLRFISAPVIVQQPRDTTVCYGSTVRFSVESNSTSVTYQWRKNGKNLDNSIGSTVTIAGVTAADVGGYDVVITNACNLSTISPVVQLKVRESAAITSQPRDTTIQANLNVTFSVAATGTAVKYQWQKNNTNRFADTLATLTIAGVKLSDSGNYKCIVKNECGSVESVVAKLKVTSPPAGAALALNLASVDFSCTKVGVVKDSTLTNIVFNGGGQPLTVSNVSVTGGVDATDFTITSGGGAFTLAPNQKRTIVIRFTPSSRALKSAFLEFTSNSSTAAPKLALTGKGCVGTIATFTADAGASNVGVKHDTTVKICNTGDFNLVVSGVEIKTLPSDFTIQPQTTTVLKPGDCLTVPVGFTPTAEGKRTAELLIKTDEGDFTIPIEGTGIPSTGVNDEEKLTSGISVYPNPSSGTVIFTGKTAAAMPINVRIFDALGNSIYQTMLIAASAGEFYFRWDASQSGSTVASGNYTALLSIGAQTVRVPFVIVR